MEKKTKELLILLGAVVCLFFTIGYTIGIYKEKTNLKTICSEYLELDIEDIKSVKYKDDSLVIDLKSIDEKLSIEDRTIYDKFNPEHILDLKDRVKKNNIRIL